MIYRINRRRESRTVPPRPVNRLGTWTSLQFTVELSTYDGGDIDHKLLRTERSACALDLDINTAAEITEPIDPSRLPELFRELADLGAEIAEKGDVP